MYVVVRGEVDNSSGIPQIFNVPKAWFLLRVRTFPPKKQRIMKISILVIVEVIITSLTHEVTYACDCLQNADTLDASQEMLKEFRASRTLKSAAKAVSSYIAFIINIIILNYYFLTSISTTNNFCTLMQCGRPLQLIRPILFAKPLKAKNDVLHTCIWKQVCMFF